MTKASLRIKQKEDDESFENSSANQNSNDDMRPGETIHVQSKATAKGRPSKLFNQKQPVSVEQENGQPAKPKQVRRCKQTQIDELKQQVEALEDHGREVRKTNRELRQQCEQLQVDLKSCRDDLYSMQPVDQVSDAELGEDLGKLSQKIDVWIDDAISSLDTHDIHNDSKALLLGTDERNELARQLVEIYPNSAEFLIHHKITFHIQLELLCPDTLFLGADRGHRMFLSRIKKSIGQLKPQRELAVAKNWSSLTMAGIQNLPQTPERQKDRAKNIAKSLHRALVVLFPALGTWTKGFERLLDGVVYPAMKFALKLQHSPSAYRFEPEQPQPVGLERIPVFHALLEKAVLRDVSTRMIVKADNTIVQGPEGVLGKLLFFTEPALLRDCHSNGQTICVRKAHGLVALEHPLKKRQKVS